MLAIMTGRLVEVDRKAGLVYLAIGGADFGLTFELLVPPSTLSALQHLDAGILVTLETYLDITGAGQGPPFRPRLFGFSTRLDKLFFQRLITVKGVGPAVALEMMSAPTAKIALAIENKDEKFLRTLPKIGASKAKLLIAELSEKVQRFRGDGVPDTGVPEGTPSDPVGQVALAILVKQLDLDEREAAKLIARTRELHPEVDTLDELLQALFEVRAS